MLSDNFTAYVINDFLKTKGNIMNIDNPSSYLPYYRSPLAKHTDLIWHMHATQEIDYQVSVVKNILNPDNPTLARTCAKHADRNAKTNDFK